MAHYVVFFSFTAESVEKLMDKPGDRTAVVGKLAADAGGRLLAYYLMMWR